MAVYVFWEQASDKSTTRQEKSLSSNTDFEAYCKIKYPNSSTLIVTDKNTDKIVYQRSPKSESPKMALSLGQDHLSNRTEMISDADDTSGATASLTDAQAKQVIVKTNLDAVSSGLSSLPTTNLADLPKAIGDLSAKAAIASIASQVVSEDIQEALDDLNTPIPPIPPDPVDDLICKYEDVTAPVDIPNGKFKDGVTFTGVISIPPADGIHRKYFGADTSDPTEKYGAICVGANHQGNVEYWVGMGGSKSIAQVVLPGKNKSCFFSMRIRSDNALVVQLDNNPSTLMMPANPVPFDGVTRIGQGIWLHQWADPINAPPGAKMLRLNVYRSYHTDEQVKADQDLWKDLIDSDNGGGGNGGGGNGGSDGPLQPIDKTAAQYFLNVGLVRPLPLRSRGSGLGSPGGQSKSSDVAKCLDIMGPLCTELRINTPSSTYLASIKEGIKRYVKYVHVTGYNGPDSGASLAASVASLITQGIPVTSCSLQNEPNFKTWTDAQTINGHKTLRSELDKRGLTHVDDVGPEFASNDSQTSRCADLLTPLSPGYVQYFGHHSYGLGVDDRLFDAKLLGHLSIGQYECGYLAFNSMSARLLNDLNRGCITWIAHRLHNTVASSDPSQNLFDNSCKPYVWFTVFKMVFGDFQVGTYMRPCTVVSSNDDATNMRWRSNNQPSDYHSPIYAACGKRPDGKWVVASYAWSGKQQPTFTFPELKGKSMMWTGNRSNPSGSLSPVSAQMSDGLLRYTSNSGELAVLVSS